jgi:hypothetical protein
MSSPLLLALIAIAGSVLGALINGTLATRAKVNEEMRKLRLDSYPRLWELTSRFSRWPRTANTYGELKGLHGQVREWYYKTGGLHLSDNSRDRYGEVQELVAAHLGASESRADEHLHAHVYQGLLDACSALRTALTEDLESRRQRSVLYRLKLAHRHLRQRREAAERMADVPGRAAMPESSS